MKITLFTMLLTCAMILNVVHAADTSVAMQDEEIFNQIKKVLKDTGLTDQEKKEAFSSLFFSLDDKNVNEEAGTVLALIIAFTQEQLQTDLIAVALEHGVTTNRLPGEFLGRRYYPRNAGLGDRLRCVVEERYEGWQEYATEKILDATELYYSLKDRIITPEN